MNAIVIAIGDELTSGVRLDTNSQWISQRLGELGVQVIAHATAADQLELCADVVRDAIARADVVVATGGLGPTADDITREAIAAATNAELVRDEATLQAIADRFSRRGRAMPQRNQRQAWFPQGSAPINNPHGTAPGIAMAVARTGQKPCQIFALPGVPAELFEMWAETVRPAIVATSPGARVIEHRRIKCFGVGESDLEQMLPDLIRRGRQPSVGITVHQATITLRITAAGESSAACRAAIQGTEDEITACLGDLIFGYDDEELPDVVFRQLLHRQATLSTIEIGTAGLLAQWMGDVSSSADRSDTYRGGLVSNDLKDVARVLGFDAAGAAGSGIVARLAVACRTKFHSDYALVVAPLTNIDDQRQKVPVALATPTTIEKQGFTGGGHPAIRRPRLAKQALNMLRHALQSTG